MPSTKVRATIAVVLAAIAMMAFVKLHFLRDENGGGEVLWNADEAYLVMADNPVGYRISLLGYLLESFKEHFYAPALANDDKLILSIIRITPNGAERHVAESTVGISAITPIGGEIYAKCSGGVCKWTGMRFQLLSDREETDMGGQGRLSEGEFGNVNGWSRRGINATRVGRNPSHVDFPINLNGRITLLVHEGNPVSVDLIRPDHAPERVWFHEQSTRRVSAAEYRQVFQ